MIDLESMPHESGCAEPSSIRSFIYSHSLTSTLNVQHETWLAQSLLRASRWKVALDRSSLDIQVYSDVFYTWLNNYFNKNIINNIKNKFFIIFCFLNKFSYYLKIFFRIIEMFFEVFWKLFLNLSGWEKKNCVHRIGEFTMKIIMNLIFNF